MRLKKCDIILPIYNRPNYVRDCINSIIKNLTNCSYNLYLVDDASDSYTHALLEQFKLEYDKISLHHHSTNLGFIRSCNFGVSLGNSTYVLLINSDVIVTPNWLSRLIQCAESDPQIAAVNPLTNYASNLNIPIAPGANFYGMDRLLAQNLSPRYRDVVTGVGFCMLLRRSALEEVGLFDEIYERGYCEDSDLCMKFTTNGYRTVTADNVYVYHQGRASFKGERDTRYLKNRQIFDARWSTEYERQFKEFLQANPLQPSRDLFKVPQQQWDPVQSMRETYHGIRHYWRQRQWLSGTKEVLKGIYKLPQAKRDIVTPEFVAKVTRPDRLRVTYVVPGISISGGIASVIQLVNELILLGVEARIVAPCIQKEEVENWKFFTQPIIFRSELELLKNFPESDIAVATLWTTAPWVAELVKIGRVKVGAYFLQDYEAWFYPESDRKTRSQVKATYNLISHKIVKSDWLAKLLAQDGYQTTKISLGMDLGLFYPRDVSKPSHPVVIAMARPNTPRRGFSHVIQALQIVKEAIPETEIILFGDENLKNCNIPFEFRDEGKITDADKLAELYSTAYVFLDGSNFQGFGRPALEAMACGAACVLTNVGGVTEYAIDRQNCLLVPPKQPESFAKAILELLTNRNLKDSLIESGFKTVKNYCHKREANKTLDYFNQILRKNNLIER
ncbi:MAG: glycosyltransferase [Xenococcaceae cyanobacterium MO_188.B29]|nr:glycosyltransferase [Xenococcaceae cyanobacterium MO_188.B29]